MLAERPARFVEIMSRKDVGGNIKQVALALELPFLIVGPAVLGGGIGYLLDRWLHTSPALMLVLGIVGVALGIRDVLKVAAAGDKNNP